MWVFNIFMGYMEMRGVEPLSKYLATIESTSIVYQFKFSTDIADKQASIVASLMISYSTYRRKVEAYPTEFETGI